MKRVFISADLEGIAGVVHGEHTRRDGREHDAARKLMTGEVNAAIEGALDGGAGQVVVNDSHGAKRNLIPEELHKEALLITGSPKRYSMMEGIQDQEGYYCVMFVGYHAAMGRHGVLSHTYASSVVREVGQAEAASLLPGVEYIDPVTLGWTSSDADNMFHIMQVLIKLGMVCI